jgi:hypothetical protein
MESEIGLDWLEVVMAILVMIFLAIYGFYFYKAVTEGKKRDLGVALMVGCSLLVSPFIAYAFAVSAKKDSDRIGVKLNPGDEESTEISLSAAINAGIPVKQMAEITNINTYCRNCGATFLRDEPVCSECNKRRVWYQLVARGSETYERVEVGIDQWHRIPGEYRIVEVKRSRETP